MHSGRSYHLDERRFVKRGTAVVLDLCKHTKISVKIGQHKMYSIKHRLSDLVRLLLIGSNGVIVAFTGDGAIIFFEELGDFTTSADEALGFAIRMVNCWRRYRMFNLPREATEIDIRVSLDHGEVLTSSEGGLWSGNPLNKASKLRGENNRIIATKAVVDKIENKFVKKLFHATNSKAKKALAKFSISIPSTPAPVHKARELRAASFSSISVVICAATTLWWRLDGTLNAIVNQTCLPREVLLAVTKVQHENAKVLRILKKQFAELNVEFKTVEISALRAKNRAAVRNELMGQTSTQSEAVCFLDGDTLLHPRSLEIAQKLFACKPLLVFAPPRIELDFVCNQLETVDLVNLFFASCDDITPIGRESFGFGYQVSAIVDLTKPSLSISTERPSEVPFAPSYALFVPSEILSAVGKWDENFVGWGEEDIDFTHRISLLGYKISRPSLPNFVAMHLTHDLENGEVASFTRNAKYLLSKHPHLTASRSIEYATLGLPGFSIVAP